MKTMKYVLSASVMTFMLASCSEKIEEENVNASQPDAGKIEMTFTSQASGTKTQLGDDGLTVVWSEGDAISIFDGADNERFSIGNINGSSAEFSGLAVPAPEYYAVYPYAEGNSMSAEGVITAVLPDSQPAIPGTFAQNVNLSFAKADAENHLSFQNLCGLLSLDLTNVPAGLESIAISGQNGEILAGTVSINAANGTTSVSGGMKVTLTGENLAGGVYVAEWTKPDSVKVSAIWSPFKTKTNLSFDGNAKSVVDFMGKSYPASIPEYVSASPFYIEGVSNARPKD